MEAKTFQTQDLRFCRWQGIQGQNGYQWLQMAATWKRAPGSIVALGTFGWGHLLPSPSSHLLLLPPTRTTTQVEMIWCHFATPPYWTFTCLRCSRTFHRWGLHIQNPKIQHGRCSNIWKFVSRKLRMPELFRHGGFILEIVKWVKNTQIFSKPEISKSEALLAPRIWIKAAQPTYACVNQLDKYFAGIGSLPCVRWPLNVCGVDITPSIFVNMFWLWRVGFFPTRLPPSQLNMTD